MCCDKSCCTSSCVRDVPIFKDLQKRDLEDIQKVTTSREFCKGEYIFQEGDPSDTLFVVHQGAIKISKISREGKEQIIRLLFQGDFFGEFALLQEQEHDSYAEVLENTTVCFIKRKDFMESLQQSPSLSFQFIKALNLRVHQTEESVSMMSFLETEKRLARVIMLFQDQLKANNQPFHPPIQKKEIATLIGSTPETVSRKLVEFTEKGYIALPSRKLIQVVHREELQKLVNEY